METPVDPRAGAPLRDRPGAELRRALEGAGESSVRRAQDVLTQLSQGNARTAVRVSVILPACNEATVIGGVISRLRRELKRLGQEPIEILVIDDGSTDGTGEAATAAGARVIRHPYNIGNGAAVKRGLRSATGDLVVLMDADGQHRPEDLERLLSHFTEGDDFDMVVGAREGTGGGGLLRTLANRIYSGLASYVAGQPVSDLTSGFRVVRASVARRFIYLLPNTFSYPSTLTLSLMRAGFAVKHVPIRVERRAVATRSKIRLIEDGSRFFFIILKIATFYTPLRIFLPLAAGTFLAGIARYLYTYATTRRFTNMSLLLFLSSLVLLALGLLSEQIAQLRFLRTDDDR